MKYQAGRYHVITWSYDSGEDSKGDFSTKARALQDMRQRVNADGYDGAAVFDRSTHHHHRRLRGHLLRSLRYLQRFRSDPER